MKKIFIGVIWTVLLVAVISVCGQSDSGLQVLKYEWKPNYRNASSTIPPMTDPQRTPSPPDFTKNADGTISLNPESRRVNPVDSPEPAVVFPRPLQRSIKAILELKNNSPKRIISIEADYVFYDRDKKEYLRYRLVSGKDIKSGRTAKIKKNVTADDLKRFSGNTSVRTIFWITPSSTNVEILSIKYEDGSVWTAKQ